MAEVYARVATNMPAKLVTYIALLRAVNVGGHQAVGMADLRAMAEALRLRQVRSLLQSGNLVFQSDEYRDPGELEQLLERAATKRLSIETDFFVRTADEWAKAIRHNPFPAEARADPGHLVLLALKQEVRANDVRALQEATVGREIVRAKGKHAYLVYPDGIGRSKLTNALIEKKLGTSGTGRNWNTVLKLEALACG